MYGSAIFWQFLSERLGAPLAVAVWKRRCENASWLDALRAELAERHAADLDDLLVEFWHWNLRTGRADDGRHYSNGSSFPSFRYQATESSFGPEPRALEEDVVAGFAATNSILLQGAATRESLRVRFDGSPALADRRTVSLVGTTRPNTHSLEMSARPDAHGDCEFLVPDWHLYDQIAVLMTNHSSANDPPDELPFSWVAEELGGEVFDVDWGLPPGRLRELRLTHAPNPFSAAAQVRYHADASSPTSLAIFDVAGRRVRSLVRDARHPFGGHFHAVWDGKDDAGGTLPAGVYFLRLETGSFTETRRISILR
jgi:hypothetical protein